MNCHSNNGCPWLERLLKLEELTAEMHFVTGSQQMWLANQWIRDIINGTDVYLWKDAKREEDELPG